jgi:hypothetical protein
MLLPKEVFHDDPMFANIDVKPTSMIDVRPMRPHIDHASGDGPDLPERLEIWEFYDKVNQIMFHLSPGAGGKILTRDGERAWPMGIPREGLPYSILMFNEQADDIFPLSYEAMIRPLQIELNKLETMMGELSKRLRRIVLYRKDVLGEGEAERLIEEVGLKEFLEAKGGDLDKIIKEISLGVFPQELVLYRGIIIDTIRETLGQSRFARAQRENVESAEEAARIGLGDDTQVGRNQAVMEEFITDTVRKWFQGFRYVATDDLIIPLINDRDARQLNQIGREQFLTATPKQIQGEFLFKMQLGSSRPTNEVREKQEALLNLQHAANFGERVLLDQFLVDWLLAFNKSPQRYLQRTDEMALTGAAIPAQSGGNGAAQTQRRFTPVDANVIRPIGPGAS